MDNQPSYQQVAEIAANLYQAGQAPNEQAICHALKCAPKAPQISEYIHTWYDAKTEALSSMLAQTQSPEVQLIADASLNVIPKGVLLIDITTTDYYIQFANAAFCNLVGYAHQDFCETPLSAIKWIDSGSTRFARLLLAIKELREQNVQMCVKTQSGEYLWLALYLTPIPDYRGVVTYYLAVVDDVTEQKHVEMKLLKEATHDALTKLPNRNLLIDRFSQAAIGAKDSKHLIGVLFVDLDKFKLINDTYGHGTADKLLQTLARRLQNQTRDNDTVARLGGDEFAIILPALNTVEDGYLIAEKVLEAIGQPFQIDNQTLEVSASVGVSFYPRDGREFEGLLKKADEAMYQVKQAGRSGIIITSGSPADPMIARIKIENALRRATRNRDFELAFQPILSLSNHEVVAIEAFVRWPSRLKNTLSTNEFIALAEKIHLMNDIGDWVLENAGQQLPLWQAESKQVLVLNINISAGQLTSPGFVEKLEKKLQAWQTSPMQLEFEISEALLHTEPQLVRTQLERLHTLGVGIILDDYGSSFSSILQLESLPINKLKIDNQLIQKLPDAQAATVVRAMINLAHELGMQTVAEGVECAPVAEFLRQAGCDYAQGYYYAKPTDTAGLLQYLRHC